MAGPGFVQRARAHLAQPLFRSAYSLIANTVLTAVLGLIFWIVAARLFSSTAVGRDSALIASMVTLSSVCQLNLANALVRFLPDLGRRTAPVVAAAYALSAAVALVLATAFVIAMPKLSHEFQFLSSDRAFAVLYVVAVLLWGVFALQDAVLTALRRAPWVPVENAVFGVMKLAGLPVMLSLGLAHGIFVAWVVPMALLLVPINYLIFRRAIPRHVTAYPDRPSALERLGRRRLGHFLAQDYVASVMGQAALAVLPLIVVALLGSRENAYFYMPFTIVAAFDMLFFNVSTSLTVEGALAEHRVAELTRAVVRRFLLLLVPGVALLVLAAPLLLLPFGSAYVDHGAPVLRMLACASVFQAAVTLYVAILRLQRRGAQIAVLATTQSLMRLGLAVALGHLMGLDGIALAWLVATALVALAILPALVRFLRSPHPDISPLAPQPQSLPSPGQGVP